MFPFAVMFFVVMMSAQRVMIMISMTAVACVREHYVLVLVVADPILAAFGLGQVSGLSAKTAPIQAAVEVNSSSTTNASTVLVSGSN